MNTRTCSCRNPHCVNSGRATRQASLRPFGTHRQAPRLQCSQCGHLVWARSGPASAGIRPAETTYRLGAKLLAEGLAMRATGRLLEVEKDTSCQWVPRLGHHCLRVMAYFFRNVHITECQLDELWTVVGKKEG